MEYLLAFTFGAVIGSFLNVCIFRLPAGQSIVSPASRCPACGTPVRSHDNVPILSYMLLHGRCRDCRSPISLRYPAVEALTGFMFVLLLYRIGPLPILAVDAAFVAALIVLSFIDLDHQIIPDVISLPGIAIGLLLSTLGYGPALVDSALGVLVGGGLLYAVAIGYHALTGREGMGGGDIKLLAMIGAFLGWKNVLLTLVLGSLSGALVGIGLILVRGDDRKVPIPFGPFLAVGALCALLFGDPLIHWYLNLAIPS
jgi:leader peptidase (prepilin peptidase)/N-methyltransferase